MSDGPDLPGQTTSPARDRLRVVDEGFIAVTQDVAVRRTEGFPGAQLHVPDPRLYDLVTAAGDLEAELTKILAARQTRDANFVMDPVQMELFKARSAATEALAHLSSAWVRGSFRAPRSDALPEGAFT